MRKMTKMLAIATLLAALVVLATGTVFAALEPVAPWETLEIALGGFVLVWGGVVAGVIEIGKHVRFGGQPLLGTPARIWAANLLLGGAGVFLYELSQGTQVLPALLAALAAVFSAVGVFEGVKTAAGK